MATIEKAPYFTVHFTLIGYDGTQASYSKEEFKSVRLNLLSEVISLHGKGDGKKDYPERISHYESDFKFHNMLETALNLEQVTNLKLIKAFADSNQIAIGFSKNFIQKYVHRLGKTQLDFNNQFAHERFIWNHSNDILKLVLQEIEEKPLTRKKNNQMRFVLLCLSDERAHYIEKGYEAY